MMADPAKVAELNGSELEKTARLAYWRTGASA